MGRWILSLALLAISAAPCHAVEPIAGGPAENLSAHSLENLPRNSVGPFWYFQDVRGLTPSSGGFINAVRGSVIGLGLNFEHRLSRSSGFLIDGQVGYGVGGEKLEIDNVTVTTDKTSFKALYGHVGGGYVVALTKSATANFKAGFFYSSTKAKFTAPGFEEEGSPYKVYGIDKSIGGSYRLNEKTSLFGELYSSFGWGRGKDVSAPYTTTYRSTEKYGCYRGGVMFGF